ncbi:MAG: RimK family alpha-L-glutamate ligase [Anaerolineae bacterium]
MDHRLHIGILVEGRYLTHAQPAGMSAALRAHGHHVTLIDPDATSFEMGDDNWLEGLDIIVARGRSQALLCLLAWAEARGVLTINRRDAVAGVQNKADMAVALSAGNVPTPCTFLGRVEELAGQVPSASYPLILKPIFGDNCRGLCIVETPDELTGLEWPEPAALAQQYLPNDGYDLKLYAVGDEIWAVRKPSPFNGLRTSLPASLAGHSSKAELLPLTPALQELGRRCSELFGLDLYGVDCIQTSDGPVVIEVNDFPNYTGVPDADERLADYVMWRARKEPGS